jgi:hypothetical protein
MSEMSDSNTPVSDSDTDTAADTEFEPLAPPIKSADEDLSRAFTKTGGLLSCHACGTAAYRTEPIPMLAFVAIALSRLRRAVPGGLDGDADDDEARRARTFLRTAPFNAAELPGWIRCSTLTELLSEMPEHAFLRQLSVDGLSVEAANELLLLTGGAFRGLRTLDCKRDAGAATLVVAALGGLREFNQQWEDNEWPDGLLPAVCDALVRSRSLRRVSFPGNNFQAAGLAHVAGFIARSPSLRWIDLYGNRAQDDGARHIAAALRGNTTLRHLELRSNGIGAEGAAALGAALPFAASLAWLSLENNPIENDGIAAIAEGVVASPSLRELRIGGCQKTGRSGDADGIPLARCVGSSTLRVLLAESSIVSVTGMHQLASAMKQSSTLAELELGFSDLSCGHAVTLAEGVAGCASLHCLRLNGTGIRDAGAIALAVAVSGGAMMNLDLTDNKIGTAGQAALMAVVGPCSVEFDN